MMIKTISRFLLCATPVFLMPGESSADQYRETPPEGVLVVDASEITGGETKSKPTPIPRMPIESIDARDHRPSPRPSPVRLVIPMAEYERLRRLELGCSGVHDPDGKAVGSESVRQAAEREKRRLLARYSIFAKVEIARLERQLVEDEVCSSGGSRQPDADKNAFEVGE